MAAQFHGRIVDKVLHPGFLVLLLAGIAGTIYLHVVFDDAGKKDVDFGAAIVSAAGIVYTVLLTIQARRASSAARFAESEASGLLLARVVRSVPHGQAGQPQSRTIMLGLRLSLGGTRIESR